MYRRVGGGEGGARVSRGGRTSVVVVERAERLAAWSPLRGNGPMRESASATGLATWRCRHTESPVCRSHLDQLKRDNYVLNKNTL